jgi:hypothetical protein
MRGFLPRLLTPSGFVLIGLCLLMPFVAVSCDAPGGFGRAAPGGVTTYTGVNLVTGGEPTVSKLLPADQQRDDRLGVQPLAIAFTLLVIGGVIVTLLLVDARLRRIAAVVVGAAAAAFLLANQATVEAQLEARLREQLTQPMPAGKSAADYVRTGGGFATALLLLIIMVVCNLIGLAWHRWRSRPGRTRPVPPVLVGDFSTPADPWAAGGAPP